MRMQEKMDSHRAVVALYLNTVRYNFRILQSTFRISSIKWLCLLLTLAFMILSACTHSMDTAKEPSQQAPESRTEVEIKQSWSGDYPVAQLAAMPEKGYQKGTGYIGDLKTFAALWSAFKPGDPAPEIDFSKNLVIFVHNIQYYNRIVIGKMVLKKGVVEVIAMETLSARQIEDVVAMSMAVVSREGVTGIQSREGIIQVAK